MILHDSDHSAESSQNARTQRAVPLRCSFARRDSRRRLHAALVLCAISVGGAHPGAPINWTATTLTVKYSNRAGWGLGLDSRFCSLPDLGALPLPCLSAASLQFSPLTLPMAAACGRLRRRQCRRRGFRRSHMAACGRPAAAGNLASARDFRPFSRYYFSNKSQIKARQTNGRTPQ